MKQLLILILLFVSSNSYGQKFDYVATTTIDSVNSVTSEYVVNIKFKLIEDSKSLMIYEPGIQPVTIRFDVLYNKRNGTYLLSIGSPDYFIVNDTCVIHHREYHTDKGKVIVRNRYLKNTLTKM